MKFLDILWIVLLALLGLPLTLRLLRQKADKISDLAPNLAPDLTDAERTDTVTPEQQPELPSELPSVSVALPLPVTSEPVLQPVEAAITPEEATSEEAPPEIAALEPSPSDSEIPTPTPEPMPTPETETTVNATIDSAFDPTDLEPSPMETSTPSRPAVVSMGNPHTSLSVEAFKQAFTENLNQVLGKTLQTASLADQYRVLALMVQDWLLQTQPEAKLATAPRIIGQVASQFRIGPALETHLLNLGMVEPIYQGLQELGLRLAPLYDQEPESPQNLEQDLGEWVSGCLDALTTANLPTIGYGICYDSSTSESTNRDQEDESSESAVVANPWIVERPEIQYEVKFGGYTDAYMDQQGRYQKRWIAQETIQGIACDTLISGFDASAVNILRRWKGAAPEVNALLCASPSPHQNEELRLKRCVLLVSCTVQDMIRLHLETGATLETLPERWAVQLNDAAAVLAIVELMHRLVDQYRLDWDQAWEITQRTFACTFYDVMPSVSGWTISLLGRLVPRHLEIIYEINRRLLEFARRQGSVTEAKIPELSLIEEVGDQYFRQRYLRIGHLAYVGSHCVDGINSFHAQTIQRILPNLNELYPNRLQHDGNGITPRRFLLQTNPRLTNLITEAIGDEWMTDPAQLGQLEPLVNNTEFCGNWWQVKRENKQSLADRIQQMTGIAVNLNSLFEVQAMPIGEEQRQLLNLLHGITLYARIKINASTDTIQRFAHRSVPRTIIFAGLPQPHSKFAASIGQLIQAVADTVNGDADMQGRLQVVYLTDNRFQLARRLYAAADLADYIPLAGQPALSTLPLRFALNGGIILGTPNTTIAELRQTVGAKNLFLFGMTATEVSNLKAYAPMQHYSANSELQQVVKLIASGHFSYGDNSTFQALGNWLLTEDPQLVLAEYPAYINTQERISQAYQDQKNWTWMSILSTAQMGNLSSDQVIARYRA